MGEKRELIYLLVIEQCCTMMFFSFSLLHLKKKERQSASTERHFQNYTEHLKRFCHPCVVFFHLKT